MANADLLKGGVIILIMIAALAAFDSYNSYSFQKITGASVAADSGSGGAGATLSVDLANYPAMFVKDGNFDALIVVGDQADSSNALASFDIALGLEAGAKIQRPSAKLASEVADTFAQNIISIGAGCSNAVTNNVQSRFGQITSARCWNGALSGEGVGAITLYDFGNGKAGLVVEGYTASDVRRAANVLKSYKDWQAAGQLRGNGILVEATSGGGTKLSGYAWATATDQTAKCPAKINVETNSKDGFYYDGDTATFSIRMYDERGNIVKRGASLVIGSVEEPSVAKFAKNLPATESGVITVSVPLQKYEYLPGKSYFVDAYAEPGGYFGGASDCAQTYIKGLSFTFNEKQATGQATSNPARPYTVDANSIDLYPGWNLISVTPPMVGKSLVDINNKIQTPFREKFPYACAIDAAWIYPGDSSGWQFVGPNAAIYPEYVIKVSSFSANDVALGLWVNVVQPEGCRFGCGTTGCLS